MKSQFLFLMIYMTSLFCYGQNPDKYDEVFPYYNGFAKVRIKDKYGYIDSTKKEVVPCKYRFAHEYIDGFFCVAKKNYYGFLDKAGKKVIPLKFWYAGHFSEGMACVRNKKKWGAIDTTGNLIIPFIYSDLSGVESGIAIVNENGSYHFIDKKGEPLEACQKNNAEYEMIFVNQFRINNSYIRTSFLTEGLIGVKKDGKWGFVDTQCNEIIPFAFDHIVRLVVKLEENVEAMMGGFSNGKCLVKNGDDFIYIDKHGNEIEKVEPNERFIIE